MLKPALVQSTPGGGAASAAITPSLSNCVAGNGVFMILGFTGTLTIPTTPTGWTLGGSHSGGTSTNKRGVVIWSVVAVAGTNTLPSITTGGPYNYVLCEFSSVANLTSTPDANHTQPGSSTAANPDLGTLLIPAGESDLILAVIQSTSVATAPYTAKLTNIVALANSGEFDAQWTVGGSQDISWTNATSTSFDAVALGYKALFLAAPNKPALQAVQRSANW